MSETNVFVCGMDSVLDITPNLRYIAEIPLTSLLCGHVWELSSDKANIVLERSGEVPYKGSVENCAWGHKDGYTEQDHMACIQTMLGHHHAEGWDHPVRIVVCNYPFSEEIFVWVDNLHSLLMYMCDYAQQNGISDISDVDLLVDQIPYYIVDVRNFEKVNVYGYPDYLNNDKNVIHGAIECAIRRRCWSSDELLVSTGYTVLDFLQDNQWLRKENGGVLP